MPFILVSNPAAMIAALLLAGVLAFDLIGLEQAGLLALIPYGLFALTDLFHHVGALVTSWLFADILAGVDFSGLFALIGDNMFLRCTLIIFLCTVPFFIYHQIMTRLVDDSIERFIRGPWTFYALAFFYIFYLCLFFMPSRDFAIATGGFFAELLVAYIVLARAVSGQVAWHMHGEQFLHYLLGFFIPLKQIYLMSLVVRGIPAEIPSLIEIEAMLMTLSAIWAPITMQQLAWGFGGVAVLCMILPFAIAVWHAYTCGDKGV
jgi:hypothetical protein